MVENLAAEVPAFGGATSHTRCFLHTVNLVVKSLIREFDVTKKEADKALDEPENSGDRAEQLEVLSKGIDAEEAVMIAEYGVGDNNGRDNDDGWVDEVGELDPDERLALEKSILPVKLALVKLRKLAYKVIHSTTIVLPAWRKILEDLQAPVTLMPRDVSTCWNSTFDMLEYAIEHREAVDTVTQC
ncbi:uncharacterized protein EDB93DRAFT_1079246 [Suillus bovinus]|uniref:uncharacterized protein n=1 Tax=Suillus bovinus TaxID=48563 RepID=UPI001B879B3C|nr:uncharacterized protein EDB93DRAFT_1079246 [Suillus bovinus]KAG2156527.1 hypothetical protein EDB93DRAFT_1079246 [Suillus bovinus]